MIEQRPFMKVGIERIWPERKQPAREFKHVVNVAGFAGAPIHTRTQLIRCSEILGKAMPSGRVSMMLRDAIPEKRCGLQIRGVGRVAVSNSRSHQLRNLAVAVFAVEIILMPLERIGER